MELLNAAISFSGGTATLIAAPISATAVIQIWGIFVAPATATTITLKDGTTAVTGAITLASGQPLNIGFNGQAPIFSLTPGNGFAVAQGSTVQFSGFVQYSVINQ